MEGVIYLFSASLLLLFAYIVFRRIVRRDYQDRGRLGWVLMYALIGHWMIITEEEHLGRVFGGDYNEYCKEVPRYLRIFRR